MLKKTKQNKTKEKKTGGSWFVDQDQMRFYALRLQHSHTARFYARWIFDSSSLPLHARQTPETSSIIL